MTQVNDSKNPDVFQEQQVWGTPGNADFFIEKRSKVEDLYRSELFFLPDVLNKVNSCLDVGCATGGFSAIMKSFNSNLKYTGLDIIDEFIVKAKENYPQEEFVIGDGTSLEFTDGTFELAHSTGIMHLISKYRQFIHEMYRVSSKYVLADFRLVDGPSLAGVMDSNLKGQDDASDPLPYYVVNVDEHVEFLKSLSPRPASINIKGYKHSPSSMAKIDVNEVYMAFVLIEKGDMKNQETKVKINLNA